MRRVDSGERSIKELKSNFKDIIKQYSIELWEDVIYFDEDDLLFGLDGSDKTYYEYLQIEKINVL